LKKLKKILLINWLYYSKQIIEVDTINFLTGKNASGKSTIIDALQIVLLGELNSRNFNKAANESSQRTLDGYLRADMDDNNPKSRRGRDFSSYIACQFADEKTGMQFVVGIVFDCQSDGGKREQFFIYNGIIPENCYIENNHAMDIASLRSYLKSVSGAGEIFYDSAKRYREDLLAKWNVHNEQVCRMLKKAVSFKPIVNIEKFITENICDIPDKPDIESMQQNIRDYKRHEMLASHQEEKLGVLKEIEKLFISMQSLIERFDIQRFLVLYAQKNDLDSKIKKETKHKNDCEENIEHAKAEYSQLESEIADKDRKRDELINERAQSDVTQTENKLREQQRILSAEQSNIMGRLTITANEIKREMQILSNVCQEIQTFENHDVMGSLIKASHELSDKCSLINEFTYESFSDDLAPFEKIQVLSDNFMTALRDAAYQLGTYLRPIKNEYENNMSILEGLKSNKKDYPKGLERLRNQLKHQLSTKLGKDVEVYILADLLEIADGFESWRGAIEGYLNTQKFYLLTQPEHYDNAITLFDKIKRDFSSQSFGLVDVGKLREREKLATWDDSLASIVITENSLAESYINYLLGKVVRCSHVNQLRRHRTAITEDGMLYQSYVVRPISKHIMDNAFIGKKAVELRIERLVAETDAQKAQLDELYPMIDKLERASSREALFTKRFVTELTQKQNDYIRGLEISRELSNIDDELSHLDLLWLSKINLDIEAIEKNLSQIRKRKEDISGEQKVLEDRLYKLSYEILPDLYTELNEKEERLCEEFTQEYIQNTGIARYEQELKRPKKPHVIAKNYTASLADTKNKVETAKRNLFSTRYKYIRDFQPCSFKAESMDNSEFDTERAALEDSELPLYREKIKKARESALEQFQNDFLSKLMSSIEQVQDQVKNLNRAIDGAPFGTDKYKFIVGRSPDEAAYYDMIMAPEHRDGGDGGIFTLGFHNKYGTLIDDLFSKIATSDDTLNPRKQSELQQNIEKYTDFRTYLKFDLETTDLNGNKELLSQTMNKKSGGETQTPFYIAMLASFAQLYRVNDKTDFGNTVRIVVFDEAFNKMDSERIIESVRLLRKMNLQAIICTPPDKIPEIGPEADRTFLALKDRFTMQLVSYGKEQFND